MKKIVIGIILLPFLLTACNKGAVPGSREAVVQINASLAEADAVTKHPIAGTSFPGYDANDYRGTYGIFVCQSGTTDKSHAHKSNSYNLMAKFADGYWSYQYVSNLTDGSVASPGANHLTLTKRDDNVTADLYAYAPYTKSAYTAGPTAIPYSIKSNIREQPDLMYAAQNKTDYAGPGTRNIGLDPASVSDLSATFTFKHAFSLLVFKFKLRNDASSPGSYGTGTTYTLNNITVTKREGETTAKLYNRGTFNALAGSFNNDGNPVTSLSVTQSDGYYMFYISSASSYTTAYLMLVPTDVADDELVFTFTVNGQTLQPFTLKRSQVLHDDSVTYGFQPGYKYTFSFTLDNYLYFDGFSVGEWTTPVDPLGEQEI